MSNTYAQYKYVNLYAGSKAAQSIMEETLRTFLSELKMTSVKPDAGSSSDTGEWVKVGVPGVELFSYNEEYFHWHHTFGTLPFIIRL
jgi:hypothetical protein